MKTKEKNKKKYNLLKYGDMGSLNMLDIFFGE
jgi:hypothetical protein